MYYVEARYFRISYRSVYLPTSPRTCCILILNYYVIINIFVSVRVSQTTMQYKLRVLQFRWESSVIVQHNWFQYISRNPQFLWRVTPIVIDHWLQLLFGNNSISCLHCIHPFSITIYLDALTS